MISRTKYPVDEFTIGKLFAAAGIEGISNIAPLGAGEYNAVYQAQASDKIYVLKIAPTENVPVMSYEKNMMDSEVFWYEQMKNHTPIRVPEIFTLDSSKALIPTSYFIMEKLEGTQMDKMDFSTEEKRASTAVLAEMVAHIHAIENNQFGYIQSGLYENWYLAIQAMVSNIITDAARKGHRSKRGKKLLAAIEHHRTI